MVVIFSCATCLTQPLNSLFRNRSQSSPNSHPGKSYDASKVLVSSIPWGTIGKAVEFTVDASKAGEGNLEITISARGRNIPTQVHPQGSARFVVGFVPLEGIDHIINITFNKEHVPGAPFTAKIHTGKYKNTCYSHVHHIMNGHSTIKNVA